MTGARVEATLGRGPPYARARARVDGWAAHERGRTATAPRIPNPESPIPALILSRYTRPARLIGRQALPEPGGS